MINVSAVDPRASSTHCGIIIFLLKEIFPIEVDILFSIDFENGKTLQKLKRIASKEKNYKRSLLSEFLGKYAGGSLVSVRPFCSVDNASD